MMNHEGSKPTQAAERRRKVQSQPEPQLYSDIILLILSSLVASQPVGRLRSRAVLQCRLVCKEWHHILCKSLFAKIDRINMHGLPILRDLQSASQFPQPFEFTFIQYVQQVTIEINFAIRAWRNYTLELIRRVRELFGKLCIEDKGRNVTLSLQNGTLNPQELIDLLTSAQHVGHLHFVWVVLDGHADTLKRILCDQSYPSLREITINGLGYNNTAPLLLPGDKIGIHSRNVLDERADTFTLDELYLISNFPQTVRPSHRADMFWPHEIFSDVTISRIIIRALVDDRWAEFWKEVPGMLKRVKDNLVELDICSELDYRAILRSISVYCFPKLQVLKLQIYQGTTHRHHDQILGDTADGLRTLLRQWETPLLNTLVLQIKRADDCIVGVEKVDKKVMVFEEKLGGIVLPLDWAGVDDAVVQTAERTHEYSRRHGLPGTAFRVLVIFRYWSGWRGPKLLAYVRDQMPQCIAHGVDIDCQVISDVYID